MTSLIQLLKRFNRDRRGVVALIFAGSLLPLTMLVGLSIDYSFYAQAQSQFSLAGDAAATYAIREATATYALESQANTTNPNTYPTLTSDAINAGQDAGNNWFATQLATLPTATVYGGEATTNTAGLTTKVTAASCNGSVGGFSATVTYEGIYPPFFDFLFSSRKNWYVSGISAACTSYTYDEVLLMLDTSGSMLIGANASDVTALNEATVCIPNAEIAGALAQGGVVPFGDALPGYSAATTDLTITQPAYYPYDNTDNVDWSQVSHYSASASGYVVVAGKDYNTLGGCASTAYNQGDAPFEPCAFACHSVTINTSTPSTYFTTSTGIKLPSDLYGVARSLNPNQTTSANGGVTLRIDAVFQATENVIQDMQDSEQVYGQYTVGVYQFNDNASPIVDGTKGTDASQEATENLSSALSAVEADDWLKSPTETAVPIVSVNPNIGLEDSDYTDFQSGMTELLDGELTNGTVGSSPVNTNNNNIPSGDNATNGKANENGLSFTSPPALVAAGNGTTVTSPLKSIIIVTDGLDDTNPGYNWPLTTATYRLAGPMTSVKAELNGTGICAQYKNLGFTVYVLYVTYNAVPNITYYWARNAPASTPYVAQDYTPASALSQVYGGTTGGNIQEWVNGPTTTGTTTNYDNYYETTYPTVTDPSSTFSTAPDVAALEACAGSPTSAAKNYGNYFFPANNATDIATAMNSILSSALNGAIRISQ